MRKSTTSADFIPVLSEVFALSQAKPLFQLGPRLLGQRDCNRVILASHRRPSRLAPHLMRELQQCLKTGQERSHQWLQSFVVVCKKTLCAWPLKSEALLAQCRWAPEETTCSQALLCCRVTRPPDAGKRLDGSACLPTRF